MIGSVLSDSQGNWHYEVSSLTNGHHGFMATITDSEGHTSSTSDSAGVNGDAKELEVLNDLNLNDALGNEILKNEHISDRTPTISGHAALGSIVTIYDNAKAIGQVTPTSEAQTVSLLSARHEMLGTVTVTNKGKWTFTSSKLAFGTHNFVADITDKNGEITSKSSGILFYIDPATIDTANTIFKDAKGQEVIKSINNETKPTITGTAEANCKITIYDHGREIATVRVDNSGHWQFQPDKPLDQGSHSFTFKQSDYQGHYSSISEPLEMTIDTIAPERAAELQLTDGNGAALGDSSNQLQPTLSGEAKVGSTVAFTTATHCSAPARWTRPATGALPWAHRSLKGRTCSRSRCGMQPATSVRPRPACCP